MGSVNAFLKLMARKNAPVVLELGTRRVRDGASTLRRDWVPHAREYLGVDFEAGPDVDVVADAHCLSKVLGEDRFDAVIACSTYEHLKYPWIATLEICRVLKRGGLAFVQTHNAFPIHSHPNDYWRFTTDCLKMLFDEAGFKTLEADYAFPCRIVSEADPATTQGLSYLNVAVLAEKVTAPSTDFHCVLESASRGRWWGRLRVLAGSGVYGRAGCATKREEKEEI